MTRLLVLLAVACSASFATANQVMPVDIADATILGSWKSAAPVYESGGITVDLGLAFNADSTLAASSICTFPGGKVLEAIVTVPVDVTANVITVNASGEQEVKDGDYTCNASIQPGSVEYTVTPSKLTLIDNGQTLDFNRR